MLVKSNPRISSFRECIPFTKGYSVGSMQPYHLESIHESLPDYFSLSTLDVIREFNSKAYSKLVLKQILSNGVSSVVSKEGNLCGFILGVIAPCIWDSDTLVLTEVAFYTKPEFKNKKVGYLLLNDYIAKCRDLKDKGYIHIFTLSQIEISPDYSRFNMSKHETVWAS